MTNRTSCQKTLAALRRTATKTQNRIGRDEPLLDAYLYVSRVRCGRATCRCMRTGERHDIWCLSFLEQGRSRTVTVPADWRPRIARAAQAYREARSLLRELGAGAQTAAAAAGERLAVRVRAGRKLLAELLAAKQAGRPGGRASR